MKTVNRKSAQSSRRFYYYKHLQLKKVVFIMITYKRKPLPIDLGWGFFMLLKVTSYTLL